MFIEMLVSESQLVVHFTVSTIEALVFGSPSINVENRLDPLHILLLVFLRHRACCLRTGHGGSLLLPGSLMLEGLSLEGLAG